MSIRLACEILAFECRDHKGRLKQPLSDDAKTYLTERTKLIKASMSDKSLNQPEPWTYTDDLSRMIFKTENELAQERYDSLKVTYEIR